MNDTIQISMDAPTLARIYADPNYLGRKFLYSELETILTTLIEKHVFDGEDINLKKLGIILDEAVRYDSLNDLVADFQIALDDYDVGDILDDVEKENIIDNIESSEPEILAVVAIGGEEEPYYVLRDGYFDELLRN